MKKLPFIIICLFYSLSALGQEPEVMNFTMPKGIEKLNEQQLMKLSNGSFNEKNSPIFHDHIYKKDGLLIYYLNSSVSPKLKKSLENYQKMMVSLDSQIEGRFIDDSKIITVNNIRFSIIEYHEKDNITIQFTSDYDNNFNFINGFIECKKTDEDMARQYLRDMLQSMHFTNQ